MNRRIDLPLLRRELGINPEHFPILDSTMSYVDRQIRNKKTPTDLVIADHQTDGVGRVGRSFYSPRSTGLYFTVVFTEKDFPQGDVTPRIALAVRDAIWTVFGLPCGIKWVNDLYNSDKKVCGILCRKTDNFVSIGIGINVERPDYIPTELSDRFGFLVERCDPMDYTRLLIAVYKSILLWSSEEKSLVLEKYRAYCNHLGKVVTLFQNDVELSGECLGISDDFSLIVDVNGKKQLFSSGEMSLKI